MICLALSDRAVPICRRGRASATTVKASSGQTLPQCYNRRSNMVHERSMTLQSMPTAGHRFSLTICSLVMVQSGSNIAIEQPNAHCGVSWPHRMALRMSTDRVQNYASIECQLYVHHHQVHGYITEQKSTQSLGKQAGRGGEGAQAPSPAQQPFVRTQEPDRKALVKAGGAGG